MLSRAYGLSTFWNLSTNSWPVTLPAHTLQALIGHSDKATSGSVISLKFKMTLKCQLGLRECGSLVPCSLREENPREKISANGFFGPSVVGIQKRLFCMVVGLGDPYPAHSGMGDCCLVNTNTLLKPGGRKLLNSFLQGL